MSWVQGPTPVQAIAQTNGATFSSSTPVGNLVVVEITQQFGGSATRNITSVVDNVDGNSAPYTAGPSLTHTGTGVRVDIYYKIAANAGTRTVTVTFTGGTCDSAVAINEYSGTILFDTSNTAQGTSTSPSVGVTAASSAQLAAAVTDVAGTTITTTTGTQRQQATSTGSGAPISTSDFTGSGAVTATWTLGTSTDWVAAIISFVTPSSPVIITQPTSITIDEGQSATFSVVAVTSGGTLSYQWKINTGGGFTNVGTNSATYTTGPVGLAGAGSVKCDVTDSNGTTTTNTVSLIVSRLSRKPVVLRRRRWGGMSMGVDIREWW